MKSLDDKILSVLRTSSQALSAYDVARLVSVSTGKTIFPNSVYRVLRRLVATSLVHNVVSLKAFIAVPQGRSEAQLLMICDECGHIALEAVPDAIAGLSRLCAARGFKPENWCLEIIGKCAECASQPIHRQPRPTSATLMSHNGLKAQNQSFIVNSPL
jgi:Fur family transcriptional regulator, zinc uptake regulator